MSLHSLPGHVFLERRNFGDRLLCYCSVQIENYEDLILTVPMVPFSISTSALSLLLVFRTTSSYDRWWEARKVRTASKEQLGSQE